MQSERKNKIHEARNWTSTPFFLKRRTDIKFRHVGFDVRLLGSRMTFLIAFGIMYLGATAHGLAKQSQAAVALAPGPTIDAQVNAIYDRMSQAYDKGDAAALARVYAKDAVVFPSRANAPPLVGREHIEAGPGSFLTVTSARGGSLTIRFRVTGRRHLGSSVIDTGVYRLAVIDAAGKKDVQVGKFMTVAAAQSDNVWNFVADTDTPMPSSAWDAATPYPKLKFDS